MFRNLKEKKVFQIEFSDLEAGIQEVWPKYEFLPDMECSNDTSCRFEVDGQLDEWHEKDIKAFEKKGSSFHLTNSLLNKLAAEKKIPKGTYMVNVSW